MNRLIATAAAFACSLSTVTIAQNSAPTLSIGDKAPEIKVAKFYNGTPVNQFTPGKAYVMEFWATWCGPCIAQIPHLAKLQKTYADAGVTVMSTAVWQREKTQEDQEKAVGDFVKSKDGAMAYTIAIDDNGWMAEHWMKAAGQNGIPAAFLVGKTGIIEWIGHPATIDSVMTQYVAGEWDVQKAKEEMAKEQERERQWMEVMMPIRQAMMSNDRNAVLAAFKTANEKMPDDPTIMGMQFDYLITDTTTCDQGYAIGRKMMKMNWDNPNLLNSIAWTVVDDPDVAHRDLDFAMQAANRGVELTESKDASILDTLARVYWEQGVQAKAKAIAWQEKAVAASEGGPMKDSLEATLAGYTESD